MNQLFNPVEMLLKDSQQVRVLSFKNFNLTYLPIDLKVFSKLESLDLSVNQLKKLPENIVKLKKLRKINLSSNSKMNWSQALSILSQCPNLEQIDLSYNRLTEIPAELYHFENLKKLVLDHNPLNVFAERNLMNLPDSLENISFVDCCEGEVANRLRKFNSIKSLKTTIYNYDLLQQIHFLLPNATVLVQ